MYPDKSLTDRKLAAVRGGCLAVALTAAIVSSGLTAAQATSDGVLTLASFGGAYTRSQIVAYVDPFRAQSQQWVEVVNYDGGLEDLREQVLALNVKWDVVDLSAANAIRACDEGLLERLDGLALAPTPQGRPAAEDYRSGTLLPCAVGQSIWATVVAYDTAAYKGVAAPSSIADFFDLQRFPGSRGLQKTARVNLEWALLADGVAPGEVYRVLETEAGLERALAVLDRIRPAIVWWQRGEEPLTMLQRRRVAMSSAWNGRVFARNKATSGSIGTVWDGNVWEREYWAIPKGARDLEAAKALIAFASDPARQAVQANLIAYSPARRSAGTLVAASVQPHLPTAPQNARQGLASDADWWARNGERLEEAFLDWVDGRERRGYGRYGGDG